MGKGMKAGRRPSQGGGAKGMQKQMAQIQAMQQMMERTQAEIEAKEVEASAGGGAVSVKVNGKKELVSITLKPEVVDPDDIETLSDILVAGINEAIKKVESTNSEEMAKITSGMNMPGLF